MLLDAPLIHLSALTLLGIAVLAGFYAGRAVRFLRLPSIIGYMAVGVLLGPSVIHLFDESVMAHLSFITQVALGLVAFSIGAELNFASLRRQGAGIMAVIFSESFGAFFVVMAGVYMLTRDWPLALIFGSMAPASAPAGTVAVIQEYRAKGPLTKALYAVVAFDDGLAIIIFAFAAAVAKALLIAEATGAASGPAGGILPALWAPAYEIVLSVFLGVAIGFAFCQMVRGLRNSRDVFILLIGCVLVAAGLAIRWHLSLILTNMAVGCVLANLRREASVRRITAPLFDVMPLVFVLFFCLAGAHLQLAALPALGALGGVYIIGRLIGKLAGARLGAMVGDLGDNVKRYIGLGILSQAGVAIGIALIVAHDFGLLADQYGLEHAAAIGAATLTTVTATSIVFEILGPITAKIALQKAGEIPKSAL